MQSNPVIGKALKRTGGFKDVDPTILTSGELGIYFINTEKVVEDGGKFKEYGDDAGAMHKHASDMMSKNPAFYDIIFIIASKARDLLPKDKKVAISGGQRRDWLFSAPVADVLEVPHIALYKQEAGKRDRIEVYAPGGKRMDANISGYHSLHIVDLLTEGSSCHTQQIDGSRTGWVPMQRNAGAEVSDLIAVVTRLQGGEERLKSIGVNTHSFVAIDEDYLKEHSDKPEHAIAYKKSPSDWSRQYLAENGALGLLSFFDPKGDKFARAKKFLQRYGGHLESVGKFNELSDAVSKEYSVNLRELRGENK